ncbi:MAG: PD-(D/E)XK nuclease family protein, partial [Deltaproteobacteria bacterium]|nr:PD-(D/E)XK nuclease family protein [Deltaproteobacteria bacterium]
GARVWSVLKEALDDSLTDPLAGALSGPQALDWILSVLQGIRVSTVRFGAPAVYVGDVAGAAGLSFHAIRVMGLSEGTIPPSLAEDPVLPGSVRAELAPGRIPTPADRALFAVRALDRAVRTASCSVVLSAPRTDLGRVQREPSSSLLEAAAALGRPDTATGSPAAVIPDMRRLRRDSFVPARRDARAARWTAPVSDASWIDRAATTGHAGTVPPAWLAAPSLDIARMRTLSSPAATGPVAGFLDRGRPLPDVPGLSATAPISASGLRRLLQCPYGFLLERVLRFEEPEEADLLREIDALSYGSLLHEVAAAFYRAHGSEFCARHHDLPHWERHASALAAQAFDAFVRWYPLAGKEISASERRRLERDVARLLAHDWGDGLPTRNHGVEVAFGYDREVTVEGDGGERLHVRGYIDRIDVEGDRTVVRDIKTGKPKPRAGRQAAPDPITDVQIALYGMVVRQHAAEWSLPGDTGAVYVYLAGMRGSERAFVDDWATLESRARAWVGVAARLLRDRAFPRSPEGDDCCYCAFGAVCGGDAAARSAAMLASAGEPGSSFLGIRTGEDDGEDA